MPQDQTVVDHLLLGRQALTDDVDGAHAEIERLQAEIERQRGEVERLTGAIDQLDSVIGMIGSGEVPPASVRTAPAARARASAGATPSRSSAPAKRAPARARKQQPGQAPKSIRVHVLEMLAAEDRDWSLAEIIDRIHDAGIQAHDDAVRSITIKLMKDGRVERVGRGQYRLTGRGSSRSNGSDATPAEAAPDEAVDAVVEAEPAADPASVQSADATVTSELEAVNPDESETEQLEPEQPADEPAASNSDSSRSYTPPLNLGQPWN